MQKKKRPTTSNRSTIVRTGNISDISGNVNVATGNITTHHTITGLSAAEIRLLFDGLYSQIDALANTTPADKADLKAEVKEIQSMVTQASPKNEKIDESFLSRRFRNVARIAPDVLDVVVAMLGNPLAGLGVVARKIAEKAKEETK